MDYRSLTSLLMRLTGVVIVVASALWAPKILLLSLGSAGGAIDPARIGLETWILETWILETWILETWVLAGAAAILPMAIGMVLIYFPATVANGIIARGGDTAHRHDDFRHDLRHLQQIAFAVLGLYFVATAMFDAVYWYAKLRLYPALFQEIRISRPFIADRDFAGVVTTGTQFVAGLALLLYGCRLADIVGRLRDRPAPAAASEAAPD